MVSAAPPQSADLNSPEFYLQLFALSIFFWPLSQPESVLVRKMFCFNKMEITLAWETIIPQSRAQYKNLKRISSR